MKKGLSITLLELIAVGAMFCEHIAYLMYDYYSPQTYIFQVVGKLSIPIACYFMVDYYRKTANLARFLLNIVLIWAVSFYPFMIFFQERIGRKQSFLFDILLGLITLAIMDSDKIKRVWKPLLLAIIIILSIHFSNYPLISILFMYSFYHSDSFEDIRNSIILITLGMCLFSVGYRKVIIWLIGASYVPFQRNLSYLGFFLAIPILKNYNGVQGNVKIANHYLVALYPIHFILLKNFVNATPGEFYQFYLYIHLFSIFLAIFLTYKTLKSKISSAQRAALIMILFAIFFLLGYYFELTAYSLRIMRAAVKIEITGVVGMLLGFTWFINEFCDNPIGSAIYAIDGIFSAMIIYAVFTQENNNLFYKSIEVKHYKVHSVIVQTPGIIYRIFCVYAAILLAVILVLCYKKKKRSDGIERKRSSVLINCILLSIACFLSRGLNNNIEYDSLPITLFCFLSCFTIGVCKNDYLGNLQTEGEQDPLTGLCNRGFFVERVQNRLKKHSKGSMLMIDMDNFKHVNDHFGHGTGDRVLIALADTLRGVILSGNYISRIGGDEFCTFLCGQVNGDELKRISEDIAREFQVTLKQRNLRVNVTISVGIAIYDGMDQISFDNLYENADKALYLAKNSGKSQYRFYA